MTSLLDRLKLLVSYFDRNDISDEQILQHHYLEAKDGVVESMYSYAILCLSDFGGAKNLGHAEYWLNLSANKGNTEAQYFLGMLYFEGEFLDRKEDKGKYWLTISAANGNGDALRYLEYDT
jgi:TPR repeat protein